MELLFGDSSGNFSVFEFSEEEANLFNHNYLKFSHQLKNKNLGLAYVFGSLFPDNYKLIDEFNDMLDIIILNKQINRKELDNITKAGFARENLNVLKQRYQALIFYGDKDAEVKYVGLYGHLGEEGYDGFILDNGCFTSLTQGKIILTSAIKLEGQVQGLNNQQLIDILLPLSYQQIMVKCQDRQFTATCNSESFWQQYAEKKSYQKIRGKTWKETVEYNQVIKPSFGGKSTGTGIFVYRTPYMVDRNIVLTNREKEKLGEQLEKDLSVIPEVAKSKDLIFKFKEPFEFHFNVADISNRREGEIEREIDEILTSNSYQLRRGNNLYSIAFGVE